MRIFAEVIVRISFYFLVFENVCLVGYVFSNESFVSLPSHEIEVDIVDNWK